METTTKKIINIRKKDKSNTSFTKTQRRPKSSESSLYKKNPHYYLTNNKNNNVLKYSFNDFIKNKTSKPRSRASTFGSYSDYVTQLDTEDSIIEYVDEF